MRREANPFQHSEYPNSLFGEILDWIFGRVRAERVLLDADLAALYGVETRVLVQAAKRNPERFPKDFMF